MYNINTDFSILTGLNKMRLSLFTDTDTSEEPKTTDSTNKDEL
jgi:hypothetical protein